MLLTEPVKDETETLRDCLDGWVEGDELAALASYETGDGGGSGASSLAAATSPELGIVGSMACQQLMGKILKKKPSIGLEVSNAIQAEALAVMVYRLVTVWSRAERRRGWIKGRMESLAEQTPGRRNPLCVVKKVLVVAASIV